MIPEKWYCPRCGRRIYPRKRDLKAPLMMEMLIGEPEGYLIKVMCSRGDHKGWMHVYFEDMVKKK